jgi:predicted dithiol-disulfide oxidoreductase (DUF899 family)
MSILKNTNSGLFSLPLTPETALALGWKIKEVHGQNGEYGHDWKCIDMERDDICAPIKFWYEPHDKLQQCKVSLYFFAEDEFGIHISSSRTRCVNTVKELAGYLEFLKQAEKHKKEMNSLFDKYIKDLKDPSEKYYM